MLPLPSLLTIARYCRSIFICTGCETWSHSRPLVSRSDNDGKRANSSTSQFPYQDMYHPGYLYIHPSLQRRQKFIQTESTHNSLRPFTLSERLVGLTQPWSTI